MVFDIFEEAWKKQCDSDITPFEMEKMLSLLPKFSDANDKSKIYAKIAKQIITYIKTGIDINQE